MAEKRVEYTYDAAGSVTNLSRYNNLVSQSLVMGTDYTRDLLGRLTFMHHRTSSSLAYYYSAYDAANRMASSSRSTGGGTPGNESATYTYDATGQLTGGSRVVNGVRFRYVGHGTSEYGLSVDPDNGDASGPHEVRPPYKLAVVVLLACYSADPVVDAGSGIAHHWYDHVSDNGVFVGFSGYAYVWSSAVRWDNQGSEINE